MKPLLIAVVFVMQALAADENPTQEQRVVVAIKQRDASNDQVALANAMFAQKAAQEKATASAAEAQKAIDELAVKLGCTIDPKTIGCVKK